MATKFVNCCTRDPITLFFKHVGGVKIPPAKTFIEVVGGESAESSTGIDIYNTTNAKLLITGESLEEADYYIVKSLTTIFIAKLTNHPLAEKLVALNHPVYPFIPGNYPGGDGLQGYQSLIK